MYLSIKGDYGPVGEKGERGLDGLPGHPGLKVKSFNRTFQP